jgi:IMP dehydrogenase
MVGKHIDGFMSRFGCEALTFDDVSLVTQYADFLPEEAELSSFFSRNIKLNIPFVSAAMDTVTESEMAIAMACLGGIGVIHRSLPPEDQADEVRKVKHYLNGLIIDPVTFNPEQTVSDMLDEKKKKSYSFTGFPITGPGDELLGIVTARDIKFLTKTSAKLKTVMTKKLITAPDTIDLNDAFEIMRKNKIGKLPIVKNGKLVGLYSFHDVKTLIENIEPDFNRDRAHRLRVAAAIGSYDIDRAAALAAAKVDAIVIDTAHGHTKGVIDTVKILKKKYDDKLDIVAGNIATSEGAVALVKAGVDAVKVGIGPGSICTTRVIAGVGIPQITAVYNAAKAVGGDVPVIADGGVQQSGDIAKAIAAGASSVMMGSALAGTQESPGEKIIHHGRKYVVYRGMGSVEAMKKSKGSRERYGQPDVDNEKYLVPQGVEGLVPFRGLVSEVIHQFAGGLKYSCGYCGARNIKKLQELARFVKVTSAGVKEAHPHDITMLKDAPNYLTH